MNYNKPEAVTVSCHQGNCSAIIQTFLELCSLVGDVSDVLLLQATNTPVGLITGGVIFGKDAHPWKCHI